MTFYNREYAEAYNRGRAEARRKADAEIAELVEMLQTAFTQGYEAGHDDTVEGRYTDASDVYEDWIEDWISEGNPELVNIDLINKYKKEG